MATGTRLRYNLTSGTLGGALGLTGTPVGFYSGSPSASGSLSNSERGTEFQVGAEGVRAVGARIYAKQTTDYTVTLWRVSDMASLATDTISATADTWSEVLFSTPVALTNGANYVISFTQVGGLYWYDNDVSADFDSPSYLTYVQGRWENSQGTFPSNASANIAYGVVDILTDQAVPATDIDFGTDPGFATIGAGEYIPLVIDGTEVVHLTDFTAAGTTGTVERAQEGTTVGDHASGAAWVHGPTVQDFDVEELVNYDTLALSSELPTGASIHSDEAADPVDGTGVVGDFHLRRDTNTLTGPKLLSVTDARSATGFSASAYTGAMRFWGRWKASATLDVSAIGMGVNDYLNNNATATLYITDASQNILGQTTSFVISATNSLNYQYELLSPVSITSGTEYGIGIIADNTIGVAQRTTPLYPDSVIIAPSGGEVLLDWADTGTDFLDAEDSSYALTAYMTIQSDGGSTWTGADSVVLATATDLAAKADQTAVDLKADLSDVPTGSTIHTDEAADPVDGTGAAGDFHLRRDTNTLTGPKTTVDVVAGSASSWSTAQNATVRKVAWRFSPVSDMLVDGMSWAWADVSQNNGDAVDYCLLNAARETIVSVSTSVAQGELVSVTFPEPVQLLAGVTYYAAFRSVSTYVYTTITSGTHDALVNEVSPKWNVWNDNTSDFTPSPDSTYSADFGYVELTLPSVPTWTGADELLLASRLLDVQDEAGATYTVVADDTGKVKRFTADCTIDLPTGLPIGTTVELMAFSANGITVQAGASATVHGGGTVAQYGTCSAICVAADTWVVTGVS